MDVGVGLRPPAPGAGPAAASERELFAMRVADRFGDHGLVGACVMRGNVVELFVMSCRVIGLGVEKILLGRAVEPALERSGVVTASFVPTDRNTPARHLFRDAGFVAAGGAGEGEASRWVLDRGGSGAEGGRLCWRELESLYRISPLEPAAELVSMQARDPSG
jgi:hypothetical protein